ncbi:Serine/threonine-protein kinase ppk6 [Choanephora cucurbitarum]|uniref:non-specific serine/threonine protein kinase n=1 Tax=Choanephora cucurbitarum TaxID=101091 RepID=A0A1C7NBD5_9FUNG|nr:Serine/threonine-protein kinase ppk6 [Choanephora cucurbitarum]
MNNNDSQQNKEDTSLSPLLVEKKSDDLDHIIIPTAEGLIRFREEATTDSIEIQEHDHHDIFIKFTQESLHSFQFSIPTQQPRRKRLYRTTLPGQYQNPIISSAIRSKTNTVGTSVNPSSYFRRRSLPSVPESQKISRSMSGSSTQSHSNTTSNTSSSVQTPAAVTDEEEEEEEEELYESEEEAEAYVPHLHNRLNQQQQQAILTTYSDWRIILTNSIAQDVLVSHLHHQMNEEQQLVLVGSSVMDLIDPSFRNRLKSLITKKREELLATRETETDDGMVLVCGNVIPIIKLDGTRSSASLWLKEKVNETGISVYIWIFEEVYESSVRCVVNKKGEIESVVYEESVQDLYDYKSQDIVGHPLSKLIPSISESTWQQEINQLRFFGSQTKRGAHFPVIVRLTQEQEERTTVQITSMPMIAGLMTIRADGIIDGCNDIFVQYLFGFSQQELVTKKNIAQLLPQFPVLLKNLKRDDLLQQGLIINNIVCRKLLPDSMQDKIMVNKRVLTHTPHNQPLPILYAIHRDGTPFEVQLQLKLVEAASTNNLSSLDNEEEYALWISFDRELAFKRFGHQHLIISQPLLGQQQQQALKVKKKVTKPKEALSSRSPKVTRVSPDLLSNIEPISPPALLQEEKEEHDIFYSAHLHQSTTIDDYIIVDHLGQGAYGHVKLAIKKDDSTQTKVVIKYVIKSRILVDCWTRDRKLGIVPVEIHILHTLKKYPHKHLGDMLDYFEDNDHYYIVMKLHGEGMDLFDFIELNETIPEAKIIQIFRQIALGVCHLHDHKIVHRDIKDENVVLDLAHGGLRLIDFGSAAYLKPGRKFETFVGTLDYAAPEILRGHTYSGKPQDIWALGILLFTLIYRENPFYDIDEIMGRELRIPFVISEGSVDLIRKMLERDVDKRIDIHQVLQHPWLNSIV